MVQLVRVTEDLPEGFDRLCAEAEAEGHHNLTRLAAEWARAPTEFVTLLAAVDECGLVGIGGLTVEPAETALPTLRMRRVYVSRAARRRGVGRTLVNALLQEALTAGVQVTVNAHPRSTAFWEALGFRPASAEAWSHAYSAA